MAQVQVKVKIGARLATNTFFVDAENEDQALDAICEDNSFKDWAAEIVLDALTVSYAEYDEVEEEEEEEDEVEDK